MANIYPGALREMASLVERSANEEVRKYAAEVMRRAATEIERLCVDVIVTRQMAGFKEVKREKADPDQA